MAILWRASALVLVLGLCACVDGKERPADGALDGTPVNTFTLEGTVQVLPGATLACSTTDKKKDCKGNLYWALFEKPITSFADTPPIRAGTVKDAQNGTTFTAAGIPVKPQLYLGAFIDDNSNMVLTSPLPDKGDPVFFSLGGFAVQAGQKFSYAVTFILRRW